MIKEGESFLEEGVLQITHLIKVLGKYIEKLEDAHKEGDYEEFNLLKKEILKLQRKLAEII